MKSWNLNLTKWKLPKRKKAALESDNSINYTLKVAKNNLFIENNGADAIEFVYTKDISITEKEFQFLQIDFQGKILKNGGACLYINGHPVTMNGTANMDINPPLNLNITLKVPACSAAEICNIGFRLYEETKDLTDDCSQNCDVLVITPDYPSTHNLYVSAFAHSRNQEYIKQGLKVQVAAISPNSWYQTAYSMDSVPVFSGRYIDLKKLLSRHQYKVIVVHFVDENLYPIFDGYIENEQLIFICHGPETTFRFLTNRCRPYFTKELPEIDQNSCFDLKEMYARKYAQKDNVEWVFVSDWLYEFSKKMLNTEFRHWNVIHNTINEELFPYVQIKAEDR